MKRKRVLIATIPPHGGGVPQMVRFVAKTLATRGYEPVLGYYEPYSLSPDLSVPSFQLLRKRIDSRSGSALNGYESHAIGAWLPELEFTHYIPTKPWKSLLASCDYHLVASGSCLAGLPYALTDRKFLAWVASPWLADRKDRVALFSWYRKLLDQTLNVRVTKWLERKILQQGTILALSEYTRAALNGVVGTEVSHGVLPMPVAEDALRPEPNRVVVGRIGFVGRYNDPRKNTGLLLRAAAHCRRAGCQVSVTLVGGEPAPDLRYLVDSLGLRGKVQFIPYLQRDALPIHLQALDVFVIPSHQEGLCIAALEAMACGCPVISTRCGGPEEFVINGETGFLVESDAKVLATAIADVVNNRNLREQLSVGARTLVQTRYNLASAQDVFWQAFERTFT